MDCRLAAGGCPAGQHRRRMQERRNFTRPREIQIGNTVAHCQRCRCEHFIRSRENDTMRCLACCAEYPYTALLAQIAAKTDQRTAEVLSKAEALQVQLRRSLRK